MYDLAEIRSDTVAWSEALCRHAQTVGGIPEDLVLTQTCGWPLVSGLRGKYNVVGVPVYNAKGSSGHLYSSAIVVAKDNNASRLEDLRGGTVAINEMSSCSGHLLLAWAMGPDLFGSLRREIYTGSHFNSVKAVAEGKVDLAAVDCVTLQLLQNHRPELTEKIRTVAYSPNFPGLPYVIESGSSSCPSVLLLSKVRDAVKLALSDPIVESSRRRKLLIEGFCFEDEEISFDSFDTKVQRAMEEALVVQTPVGMDKRLGVDEMTEFLRGKQAEDKDNMLDAVQVLGDIQAGSDEKQIFAETSDGRTVSVFYPGEIGVNPFPKDKSKAFRCVGFFGERPRLHLRALNDSNIVSKIWSDDGEVKDSLDADLVLIYMTLQRLGNPGGNHFNLIVFKEGRDPSEFKNSNPDVHIAAIRDLAPFYYSKVRIHRCLVSTERAEILQTLAVNYFRGKSTYRRIHLWEN